MVERRDRRTAAFGSNDAELAAVDAADAVGNVELDLASLGQRLDRVVEHGDFRGRGIGEVGDHHPEDAAVLGHGIDPRFDLAAVGSLVGRGFDLGIGGKGDREGVAGISVFRPALRRGRGGGGNRRDDEGDQAHFGLSEHDPEHLQVFGTDHAHNQIGQRAVQFNCSEPEHCDGRLAGGWAKPASSAFGRPDDRLGCPRRRSYSCAVRPFPTFPRQFFASFFASRVSTPPKNALTSR